MNLARDKCRRLAIYVSDHDLRALGGKQGRDGAANPGATSGDDGRLSCQTAVSERIPWLLGHAYLRGSGCRPGLRLLSPASLQWRHGAGEILPEFLRQDLAGQPSRATPARS